jgi:hypothetical protein
MEPYYVVPSQGLASVMFATCHMTLSFRLLRHTSPARDRYDERLRRWGGDKQTHAYELASRSFEFFVVAVAGIVHQPHVRVKSWSRDSGIKCVAGDLHSGCCVVIGWLQVQYQREHTCSGERGRSAFTSRAAS